MSVVVNQNGPLQQPHLHKGFSKARCNFRHCKDAEVKLPLTSIGQQAGVAAAAKRPIPLHASFRPRRKGCTRCVTCSAVTSHRHSSSTRSAPGVWRDAKEATPSGAAPSALRGQRALPQLHLALPAARTNVSQADTTVRFLGFRNVALSHPPPAVPSPGCAALKAPASEEPMLRPSPFGSSASCSGTPAACIATPNPHQSQSTHSAHSTRAMGSCCSRGAAGRLSPAPAQQAAALGGWSASGRLRPLPGYATLALPAGIAGRQVASAPCSIAVTSANTPVGAPTPLGASMTLSSSEGSLGGECLKRTRSGFALIRARYATSAATAAPSKGHFIAAAAPLLDETNAQQGTALPAGEAQRVRPGTARRVLPGPSPAMRSAVSLRPQHAQQAQHALQPWPAHHAPSSAGSDASSTCLCRGFDVSTAPAVQQDSPMQLDTSPSSPSYNQTIPLFSFQPPMLESAASYTRTASSAASTIHLSATCSMGHTQTGATACSCGPERGVSPVAPAHNNSRPSHHPPTPFLPSPGTSSSPATSAATSAPPCGHSLQDQAQPSNSWRYYRRQFEIKSEQAFTCLEVVDLAPAPSALAPAGEGAGGEGSSAVWDGFMWPLRSLAAGISRKMSPGKPSV